MGASTTHDDGIGAITPRAHSVRAKLSGRSIILVGMMGAGKSSIGRRLAAALDLTFNDADAEIERAAGMSVEDIFREHGEAYFREGEERVIKRLLQSGPMVLATGGGAPASVQTRAEMAKCGVSIWLNAPIDLLMQRVARRDNRPLLKTENPRGVMERLLAERAPYYAQACLTFESRDAPHEVIVNELLCAIEAHLQRAGAARSPSGANPANGEAK